jgi:hypothetical protein
VPDTLPRMLVWKGGKIREYADLDKCSGNSYGKRPQKSLTWKQSPVYFLVFLIVLVSVFCCILFVPWLKSSRL